MPSKYVKRWERGCWPRPSIEDAFWERANKSDDGCWLWSGHLNPEGYGILRRRLAHRFAYELLVGVIPEGLQIDHLCNVRNCVNPAHMEPVTNLENQRRAWERGGNENRRDMLGAIKRQKTHCPQGHPYSGSNLRIDASSGARRCRICDVAKSKRYMDKKEK